MRDGTPGGVPPAPSLSVVIPTLNGGRLFRFLCKNLQDLRERMGVEVLIIDSGSTDGSAEIARDHGLDVHPITKGQFGHGRTRNLGVEMTSGEVVAFLTQDVLPVTPDWPLRFVEALEDPTVAGVYGRQVPRDATTMEMFFVALNYPGETLRFDPQPGGHHPRPGRVLFSNAFSAIRRDVWEEVPLPSHAQFSEDQIWAYLALKAGYSIRYEPRAEALHAHSYTLKGLFRRSHAVGRALSEVTMAGGATFGESVKFLSEEIRYFMRQGHTHRIPQLLPYEFVRWAGFQVGRRS
jgi:rhamnosyltransferase